MILCVYWASAGEALLPMASELLFLFILLLCDRFVFLLALFQALFFAFRFDLSEPKEKQEEHNGGYIYLNYLQTTKSVGFVDLVFL